MLTLAFTCLFFHQKVLLGFDLNFEQKDESEGGENVGGKGTKRIRSKPRCEDAGGAFLPPPP